MTLQELAEHLLRLPSPPDVIDLHVKDTLAAFLIGMKTSEGRALAKLFSGRTNQAELAAAAAGMARLSECDDIHLASCITPGSVTVPVALSLAGNCAANDLHRAVAAGYAAGLRLGIGIGGAKALAAGVWPTLLAAPVMAAVTASCIRGHDPRQLTHAIALALAGASGRLGRPGGVRTGRWFLLADAVVKGIRASEAAGDGFQGDIDLVSKPWLVAQAGHDAVDLGAFDPSVHAPSIADVGFKPYPIARQGVNAVAAFQCLSSKGPDPCGLDSVQVFVPGMNVALLSRPVADDERLSRLCNMGFQLACASLAPELLYDAERTPSAPLMEFARRVSVTAASDLEAHLPGRWAARIVVTSGGKHVEETVIRAPFDHDAPELRQQLKDKWRRLLPSHDVDEWDGPQSFGPQHNFWPWSEYVGRREQNPS